MSGANPYLVSSAAAREKLTLADEWRRDDALDESKKRKDKALEHIDQTYKQNLMIQLIKAGPMDLNQILTIHELKRCLSLLEDDAFVNSITDMQVKKLVVNMRDSLIEDTRNAIKTKRMLVKNTVMEKKQKLENAVMEDKQKLKAKHELMKTKSHEEEEKSPETCFEENVWNEIDEIRNLMIDLKQTYPGYFLEGIHIPKVKQLINTSEKAMLNSTLDPDEREKTIGSDESASDDDVHNLGFSEKGGTRNIKGFVEADTDDDVKKHTSREDRKASKLQDKKAGKDFWNQGAAGAGGGAGAGASGVDDQSSVMKDANTFLRKFSELKQVERFVPSLSTHHTKAGLEYATNTHVYVLKRRFHQILNLQTYLKVISHDKGTPHEVSVDEALVRRKVHLKTQKIMKRLDMLKSEVGKILSKYEKKYTKLQHKELKKKGIVKLDDKKFLPGDEVNLYWIEYNGDCEDEKSRECMTEIDEFEPVYFQKDEFRNKKDRYVIRMRKRDFDDLVIIEKKMRRLKTTVENEDSTDHEYVLISVWDKDPNWRIEKVAESSSEAEEISESSNFSNESRESGDASSCDGSSDLTSSSASDDEEDDEEAEATEEDDEDELEKIAEQKRQEQIKELQRESAVYEKRKKKSNSDKKKEKKKARLDAGES